MKIQAKELSDSIKLNLSKFSRHIPSRIQSLLEDFADQELQGKNEIELFEALIKLLYQADREPASSIANLMVPLDTEAVFLLDEWTLSNSAAFIRDYLKKDELLCTLKSE